MADGDDIAAIIAKVTILKRRRTTVRGNITRLVNDVNNWTNSQQRDELYYTSQRLEDCLKEMKELDRNIHENFTDAEYNEDVIKCEEYEEVANRAIFKSNKLLRQDTLNYSTTPVPNVTQFSDLAVPSPITQSFTVKLPAIKLEPFRGDIEQWQNFWEQFESSIDKNSQLSTIDKHVFLRGYLQDEPRRLVDGISVIADTYDTTKQILKDKYGDRNRIIQAHLDFLESLTPVTNTSPEDLNILYIECNRRLQALRALGEDIDSYGRVLVPKILRAFPTEICKQWILYVKREKLNEGNITRLLQFLAEEVESAMTAQKIQGEQRFLQVIPTMSSFQVSAKPMNRSKKPMPFCLFCETSGHWPQNCTTVTDVDTRIKKLKDSGRCFLCTNRGHNAKNCARKDKVHCTKCKGKHHISICKVSRNTQLVTAIPSEVNKINVAETNYTYLQTARIYITGPTGITKLTKCLLDGGSQSSFVHSNLIDDLQLEVMHLETLKVNTFESTETTNAQRRRVKFKLSSYWNKNTLSVTAFERVNSYTPHPHAPTDIALFAQKKRLKLADPPDDGLDLPIELLIGGDFYWNIIKEESPIKVTESLALIPSIFGYILSGTRSNVILKENASVNHVAVENVSTCLDNDIRQFWDLETIGIKDEVRHTNMNALDSKILKEFHDSYRIEDGRRVVSLPWKKDVTLTCNNIDNAKSRFHTLTKRFTSNQSFRCNYEDCMKGYIENDQVEIAPSSNSNNDKEFYLPHHAVKRTKQESEKWRVVFDASSRIPTSPSLNDALEVGPNLLPDILAVLLRFRLHEQALTGDGTQAFLQLSFDERDRDATRFLWFASVTTPQGLEFKKDEIATYRFKRLPFGLSCSPFLLSATLRELATTHKTEFPLAAFEMHKSFYMDDIVSSTQNEEDIVLLYNQLQAITSLIKLPMGKWATNCTQLLTVWNNTNIPYNTHTQVLGVSWNSHEDALSHDFSHMKRNLLEKPLTKHLLLRSTASCYDPLGIFAPVIVYSKLLFQDTWLRGIQWDEILPSDIVVKWRKWFEELSLIPSIQVPRWIGFTSDGQYAIHVFCDASERAYGSVLYLLTTQEKTTKVHIVCSRNRLAPIKRVTLPRLELLSALTGARLLAYFCRETNLSTSSAVLWTDSTVTLSWIRSDPNKWKTFVCNRVTEIQRHTNPAQWRHCPGKDNPADCLSRGVTSWVLNSSHIWWNGPPWLVGPPESWPNDCSVNSKDVSQKLEARNQNLEVLHISTVNPILDISRFSKYFKLLRATAWIMRFITNCRSPTKKKDELNAQELEKAHRYWISIVQQKSFSHELELLKRGSAVPDTSKIAKFNPFLEDGLIRLGGRLHFAQLSDSQRHPLLLDGSHRFTTLLIQYTHVRLHHLGVRIVLSELRDKYWIIRGRQAIKMALRNCLPCKISRLSGPLQIEAPLPADRIRPSPPFTVTGIDFAGPLYVRQHLTTQKTYIALFTCATTRALHLETVSDLSTDRFLMALQRFVSRRGFPHTIYSDNATTFHATNKELTNLWNALTSSEVQQFYAHNGIRWKFIVPRAAWWGGWWERMVGSVKRCLRKILGSTCLDEESLRTVLIGIEAALNSRPIVQENSEEEFNETLTPAHFLTGRKLTSIPSSPKPIDSNLTKRWQQQQGIQDHFWRRWSKEYLLDLRNFHQVKSRAMGPPVRVGDVVLLHENVQPRHLWKKAVVEELFPGRDGKIRSCMLRSATQKIKRPIQLVIPLEIDQGGEHPDLWGDQGGEDVKIQKSPAQ